MTYNLIGATVHVRAADLVLTYTTDGVEPAAGAVTYSATFVDASGNDMRQVGYKIVDSRLSAAFCFDHTKPMQYNAGPNVSPSRVGDTHAIVFPIAALGNIRSGNWRAELAVDQFDRGQVEGVL